VPPLLSIFESPNFVVDFSGRTSCGKTAALRVAASVWGNPDERAPAAVLKTWDGTATWRERVPAVLNNLPFLLDDTKHARHPHEIAKSIYGVAQGVGRGRGTTKGLARQETWRTVLLTSGEQPATSHTEDGGTRPRVLSLWGSPFGETDAQTGKLVRQLTTSISRNYGHGGPLFVGFLIEHRHLWSEWRKEYRVELEKYEQWAAEESNPFAGRMAALFAAVTTAAWLAHESDILPWSYADPIEPLWEELVTEAGEANRAAAALRHVMDWAYAHQEDFFGRAQRNHQPHGGWAGRWEKCQPVPLDPGQDSEAWRWIGFVPLRLSALLRDAGYEPESIIRTWRDDGWLLTNNGADGKCRRTYKARIGQEKTATYLIAIDRKAVDLVRGEN
jgi:putative DNA primase/helicase